jgi:hypothetical protein
MLGVTVDVVAIVMVVMTARAVLLITPVCVFWKHMSFLFLVAAISSWSSFSSAAHSASCRSSIATLIVLGYLIFVRAGPSFEVVMASLISVDHQLSMKLRATFNTLTSSPVELQKYVHTKT